MADASLSATPLTYRARLVGKVLIRGLHDGYDLAWKLALVLRGHAHRSLLDDYAVERKIADRHVLDVSDQVHRSVVDIVDTIRRGRELPSDVVDPVATALMCNARAMIDVDYAGSPLVADYGSNGAEPHPGNAIPIGRCSVVKRITCLFLDLCPTPRSSRGLTGVGPSSWRSRTIPTSIPCARVFRQVAWS
jgi:FAD binding domain